VEREINNSITHKIQANLNSKKSVGIPAANLFLLLAKLNPSLCVYRQWNRSIGLGSYKNKGKRKKKVR